MNSIDGTIKVEEPLLLMQCKTKDFIKSILISDLKYVEHQFLIADRQNLDCVNLILEDVYLMDTIYRQSSAFPYYQTRGIVRKNMLMKINPSVGEKSSLSVNIPIKTEKVSQNGFQNLQNNVSGKDSCVDMSTKANEMKSSVNGDIVLNDVTNTSNGFRSNVGARENVKGVNSRADDYSKNFLDNQMNKKYHVTTQEKNFKVHSDTPCIDNVDHGTRHHPRTNQKIDINTNLSELKYFKQEMSADKEGIFSALEKERSKLASNAKIEDISNSSVKINSQAQEKTPEKPKDLLSVSGNNRSGPTLNSTASTDIPLVTGALDQSTTAKSVPFLSEEKSYDVIFGDKLQLNYLVLKQSDVATLEIIHSQLKQENLQPWLSESSEKKVVVITEDKYYRGIILTNNITEIKGKFCIKLVDVGWILPFNLDPSSKLMVLPEKYRAMKPLAFPINIGNVDHIPRNTCVTVVDSSMFNEKVKSVVIKQVHPFSSASQQVAVPASSGSSISNQTSETSTTTEEKSELEINLALNTPVSIIYVQREENNKEIHWVQDAKYYNMYDEWQSLAEKQTNSLDKMPQLEEFCLKMTEGEWNRTKVVALEPLTVLFIDFGSTEVISSFTELKPIPKEMASHVPLAYKIKFYNRSNNETKYEFGDAFDVTPIHSSNNVYTVLKDKEEPPAFNDSLIKVTDEEVRAPKQSVVTPQIVSNQPTETPVVDFKYRSAAISQPSTLELNKPAQVGFVQDDLHNPEHKWVQEVQFYDFLEQWTDISTAQTAQFVGTPTVGDYCIHFYEEIWCRAKIVKVKPLTVLCIDYGNEAEVLNATDIKPLPLELSTTKPLAHRIQFFHSKSATASYAFGDTFSITPIKVQDNVLIVLKNDEVATSVINIMYQSPVPSLVLNETTQVTWLQSDEFDPQYIWVSDLTHLQESETFVNLMSDSSCKYSQTPQLGELCCKEYDELWCRAKVACLDPLTIFYIDFGNVEEVSLDQLKPLPPQAAQYSGFAFRVIFADKKPDLNFGELLVLTPVSFDNNVYTVSLSEK